MGTSSPHGFRAFFKTNNNRPTVLRVLQNMIDGSLVTLTADDTFYGGATTTPHTFVCLNEGNSNTIALWNGCRDNPDAAAFQTKGSNWIILCPKIWTVGGIPTNALCPNMASNKFVPNEDRLAAN